MALVAGMVVRRGEERRRDEDSDYPGAGDEGGPRGVHEHALESWG